MQDRRTSLLHPTLQPGIPSPRTGYRVAFVSAYRNVVGGPEARSVGAPDVSLRFYPYTNLKNTLRVRLGVFRFRISDILSDAPLEVLEAAFGSLLARWSRRPTPEIYRRIYRAYLDQTAIEERVRKVRRSRSVKRISNPAGRHYNLEELFDRLNDEYFDNQLSVRQLGWSVRAGRRSLGHYDSTHDTIVVNRRLDRRAVPAFVVEYVLYHEMLHAWLGLGQRGERCRIHPPEFKRAERHFSDFERAQRFINTRLG